MFLVYCNYQWCDTVYMYMELVLFFILTDMICLFSFCSAVPSTAHVYRSKRLILHVASFVGSCATHVQSGPAYFTQMSANFPRGNRKEYARNPQISASKHGREYA